MNDLRIVFMGTPDFGAKCLSKLIDNGYNIVLVVSQPDKEVGRKKEIVFSPVKKVALEHNIEVFQPAKIRLDYQKVLDAKPDLIITSAYGQIIPDEILNYPKYKCINTHGSLLPKRRGGAPIQRSIMEGDKTTGVTIMYMSSGMDEGDILYMKEMDIDIHDTNTTLFDKLAELASNMLIEFLPKFFNNDFTPIKQDNSLATYSYNIKKEEELINFNEDVLKVYNHIRGLLDNPGCYFELDNTKYKIISCFFEENNNNEPGKIIGLKDNQFVINCLNGSILIKEIKPEGKNTMDAKSFYNGKGKSLVGKIVK